MSNAPQEASYQQTVSELRSQVRSALTNSVVNKMSPVEQQVLDEWGVSHLVGEALLSTIDDAFDRNQITVQTALEEINAVAPPVRQLVAHLEHLIEALSELNIGAEELDPGEFEIDVLIPRTAVRDELGALGRELAELERILLPFVELTTGSRPGIRVQSVGSSDFTLFLAALPGAAVVIAKAIDEVLKVYERVLSIRKMKAEIEALQLGTGADDTIQRSIEPLEDYANSAMQQGTTEIAKALIAEFGSARLPAGRPMELEIEVRRSLLKIAERIDDGYNISVRAGELPPATEDEGADPAEDSDREVLAEQVRAVEERAERSRHLINLTGAPILSLEYPAEAETGDDVDE
jgi:hypothetical protein